MNVNLNTFLNMYGNNPFSIASFGSLYPMNESLFSNMFNFQLPQQSLNFDFSNLSNFGNFNFNFNFGSLTQTSSSSSVREGHCKANAKLDKAFLDKVKQIASRINCDYKDLLGVMHSESGINPQAVNRSSNATGLIQFMPSTAKSLGTTTEALKNMSAVQQLDYVEKFFQRAIKARGMQGKRLTAGDLYTLVFMPAKVHSEVICQAGSKEYNANKGLDTNKDGVITKTELGNRVIKHHVDESIFA